MSIPAFELNNATVMLDDHAALRSVTLKVFPEEHVAILGPNGSGKSTLIRLLTGDVHPLHRDAPPPSRMFGLSRWVLFDLRAKLGIVSDSLLADYTPHVTGRRVVESGFFGSMGLPKHLKLTPEMKKRADEVMAFLEIEPLSAKPLERMSSGEKRRVLIGRALVHRPQMLIFDEPFNSLDLKARAGLTQTLRKLARDGHALVLVTHSLEEIPPEIDRVVMMKAGTVFADGAKEDLLTSDRISELFDTRVEVRRQGDLFYSLPI